MTPNNTVKVSEIQTQFPQLFTDIVGDPGTEIAMVETFEEARAGAMAFVHDPRNLQTALSSKASVLVFVEKSRDQVKALSNETLCGKTVLFTKNVRLSLALVKGHYFSDEHGLQKIGTIHSSAVIDPTSVLGKNVSVGPHTVIGQNVNIGDNVKIDASVVIEADCKIGSGSHLYSHLYLGPRTEVGKNCVLMAQSTIGSEGFGFAHDEKGHFHRIPQSGKVVLEDNVEIGSHCTIDRATFGVTRIGEGSKLDKQCHVAHNCEIGKHTVIAASLAVAGSTKIGSHCVFGGRITIRDGISICDGVELAAFSGVHNNITVPGKYGGHPLLPIMDSMRTIKTLAHLPKMRKQLSKIFKHLGIQETEEET